MATLAERYWQELRPSAAAREALESPVARRRRPRRRVDRERALLRRSR
jgi:hypothetical protein